MSQSPQDITLHTTAFQVLPFSALETNDGQLEGLPANPREIGTPKFDLLKQNITNHPEFLRYNLLKVFTLGNDKYIIIGGNMRFRAMQELGYTSALCAIIDPATDIETLKAYVILDNATFGKWEWSQLANEWDAAQLTSWGVDLPVFDKLPDDFFVDSEDSDGSLDDYQEPEKTYLQCPHCHHVDSKVHFKKVHRNTADSETSRSDEDISLGD